MTSVTDLLATLAILSFAMGAAGFLALVWRASWAARGFVEAEGKRAESEAEIVRMLGEFIHAQRTTNEQVWTALQVQADRLNHLVERAVRREYGSKANG